MKRVYDSNIKWIVLAMFCFLLEALAANRFNSQPLETVYSASVEQQIERKKNEFELLRKNDSLMAKIRNEAFDEKLINALRQQHVIVLAFGSEGLSYWTSVAIDESIKNYKDSIGFGIAKIKRGWYLFDNKKEGDKHIMLCYPLYRHYQISNNPLLDEGFNSDLEIGALAEFSFDSTINGATKIGEGLLQTPVYVRFIDNNEDNSPLYLWILSMFGLLFTVLFLFNSFEYLEQKYSYLKAWIFLAGSVVLLRAVGHLSAYPSFRKDLDWFNPEIYHLGNWIPSLGDLFIDSVLIFILTFTVFKGVLLAIKKNSLFNWAPLRKAPFLILAMVALMFGTCIMLGVLQSLIHDSNLNFDITNILSSGYLTLLGLLIAAMLLCIHLLWVNILVIVILRRRLQTEALLNYFLVAALLFLVGFYFSGLFDYVLSIQSISYLIAIFITYQLVINQNYFQRTAAILFVVSVFASSLFYRSIHDRELELRQRLAEKIYSPKDQNAESLFLEIEAKIEYDAFISEYFRSPVLQKSLLEKRVKQLYFSGYLSRFEVEIFDFDTLGNSFKEMNDFDYSYLEEVYNNRTQSTQSNHFYLVNEPALRFGYMAKYEVCTPEATLGKLFILLKPKFVQDEKIFTELLSNADRAYDDLSAYSYAIYQEGELINHSGAFPYSLEYDFDYTKTDHFIQREGFSHLVREGRDGILVVVSKKRDTFLEPLTIFSFLFLTFSLFVFAVFFSNLLYMWLRIGLARFGGKRRQLASFYGWMSRMLPYKKFRGLFFSTRIQLAMIGLVLIALLITGYVTIQYITFKYSERQEERLNGKVKSVLSSIENERRFADIMLYQDELSAYLNQLADFYNTDINLFDLNGRLIASTQNRIFDGGMLLNRINPIAFAKLSYGSRSQHTQKERIGKLDYLASYVPVFNSNHVLIAYMNVPFFSNERELRRELSSFLENFINIYLFFFILAGIFAYLLSKKITSPLIIIQERLAATRLGNRNERLEWRQQDEIGQLVKQYNSMLKQLERSAEILAKSEREDAWKEMARQIAHEIKNPLTPMKLSVQHLQRSWANKNENLDNTFKRVTAVLIEQIDSLSVLATEFASFAQIPTAKVEEFELSEVISSVVELYFNAPEVDIHFSADKEKMLLLADKNQFSRAFHNILKNAVESIPEDRKGRISINLSQKMQHAIIEVSDNGCGMAADVAEKIFTPSFSTKNSGMGLGLAITKQIIENAGGQISFTSTENEGTTFVISIPLAKVEDVFVEL